MVFECGSICTCEPSSSLLLEGKQMGRRRVNDGDDSDDDDDGVSLCVIRSRIAVRIPFRIKNQVEECVGI